MQRVGRGGRGTVRRAEDDDGLPCIVMEYVLSITLDEAVKRRGALPTASPSRAAPSRSP